MSAKFRFKKVDYIFPTFSLMMGVVPIFSQKAMSGRRRRNRDKNSVFLSPYGGAKYNDLTNVSEDGK